MTREYTIGQRNPVQEAQNKIAKILKELEEETGQTIKALSLDIIDTSNIHEERNIVQVKVEMYRVPARDWAV